MPEYEESDEEYKDRLMDEHELQRIRMIETATKSDCIAVLGSMRNFLDRLFRDPPAGMRGELLSAQNNAWLEIRETVDRIAEQLYEVEDEEFESAGLNGLSGAAKFKQWVSARFSFSDLSNSRRAARVLQIGANIGGSIAGLVGAAESVKEAYEAIKYVADLAVDESG